MLSLDSRSELAQPLLLLLFLHFFTHSREVEEFLLRTPYPIVYVFNLTYEE